MQKKHFRILVAAAAYVQDYHFPPMEKKPFPLYLSHFPGMGHQKAGRLLERLLPPLPASLLL